MLRLLPITSVKEGIVDRGLLVDQDVRKNGLICEYIGNRISGRNMRCLNSSLYYHGVDPIVLVSIPWEHAVIDPRVVGTAGQYVNHSCSPNAILGELDCRGITIVFITALRLLKVGEEILID